MVTTPVVTYGLMAAIALVFFAQMLVGPLDSPLTLLRMGANAPALVAAGEWWRLVTANFLHGGHLHLYLNGLAIYTLGALVERLIGPWRLFIVAVASAVGGAGFSVLMERAALSVGASTAVFGLLGALALLNWRYRRDLPLGFRQPLSWWAFVLTVNGSLPIFVPQIDAAAHLGGFACGAAAALLLYLRRAEPSIRPPTSWTTRAVALLLAGSVVVAFGTMLWNARATDEELQARWERSLMSTQSQDPEHLNELAWSLAVDPKTSRPALQRALRMAERAAAVRGDSAEILDTVAVLRFRLGDAEGAAVREAIALDWASDDAPFASHLLRFLSAHRRERGVLTHGALAADAVSARVEHEAGTRRFVLALRQASPAGVVVWATARSYGAKRLLRFTLGPKSASVGEHAIPERQDERWPDGLGELEVLWVDSRASGGAPDERSLQFWAYDERNDVLPRADEGPAR